MKSISIFFFFVMVLFCVTSQTTNAQEEVNRTEQQLQIKKVQANRDALIADMTNLASLVQQYYRKPTVLGGGGNRFSGWFIPEAIDTTANGMFTAIIYRDSVKFAGYGNAIGNDGKYRVRIFMVIDPNKIKSVIVAN